MDGNDRNPPSGGMSSRVLKETLTAIRQGPWRRDEDNGWLGGVCAGVATRTGSSPMAVRAVAVVAGVAIIGIFAYLAAWSLMPNLKDEVVVEEATRGKASAVAVVIATVLSIPLCAVAWIGSVVRSFVPFFAFLLLLVLIIAWMVRRPGQPGVDGEPPTFQRTQPVDLTKGPRSPITTGSASSHPSPMTPPPWPSQQSSEWAPGVGALDQEQIRAKGDHARKVRREERRTTRMPRLVLLLVIVLVFAVPAAVARIVGTAPGHAPVPWAVFSLLGVLSLIGTGLALNGFRGGILWLLIPPLMLASLTITGFHTHGMSFTNGSIRVKPDRLAADQTYTNGVGSSTIDLRNISPATMPDHARVHARTTLGNLSITVPAGVRVKVRLSTHIGATTFINDDSSQLTLRLGFRAASQEVTIGSGPKTLEIDAETGAGMAYVDTEDPLAPIIPKGEVTVPRDTPGDD